MTAPIADSSGQHRYDVGYDRYAAEAREPEGTWLVYSIVLLSIAGVLNLIGGIAAASDSHFYIHNTHYVFANLKTYGWILTVVGAVQLLVAFGVSRRNQVARWVGVVSLSVNAVAALLMLPAYPFWSLAIFSLDLVAIFGLIGYGQKPAPR